MDSLRSYLLFLVAMLAPLCAHAEMPAAFKTLAWKKFAQELSKDPFFQAEIKKVLPGLNEEGKAAVTKCASQMIAGKGVIETGTVADGIIAKELRRKARAFLPKEDAATLDQVADAEVLAAASGAVSPKPAEKEDGRQAADGVHLMLDSDLESGLGASGENPVKLGKPPSRFKLASGLADRKRVSFELAGKKDHYLRHFWGKLELQERPSKEGDQGVFDNDATFKMTKLPGDKVQFETINYPGKFLSVDANGNFVTDALGDGSRATFRLIKK